MIYFLAALWAIPAMAATIWVAIDSSDKFTVGDLVMTLISGAIGPITLVLIIVLYPRSQEFLVLWRRK